MINFVICDDKEALRKKYISIIDKYMMKYDIDYEFKTFDGYDKEWEEYAESDGSFKIYLLDIKTSKGSGINAARKIREKFQDWSSMIMIITAYNEYKYDALGKRLMLVDFINKLDNCEKRLIEALDICIKNYYSKPNSLKFTYKNIVYNIEFKHILYIEKEQNSKKCTIYTTHGIYYTNDSLKKIMDQLDKRFLQIYRSIIINKEQIESYNTKENKLYLKSNQKITDISRTIKKELVNYVRGLS